MLSKSEGCTFVKRHYQHPKNNNDDQLERSTNASRDKKQASHTFRHPTRPTLRSPSNLCQHQKRQSRRSETRVNGTKRKMNRTITWIPKELKEATSSAQKRRHALQQHILNNEYRPLTGIQSEEVTATLQQHFFLGSELRESIAAAFPHHLGLRNGRKVQGSL